MQITQAFDCSHSPSRRTSDLVFVQIKWRLYDTAVAAGAGIYVSRMYDLVHDPYSVLFSNSVPF